MPHEHYQLSDFQYNAIMTAANSSTPLVLALDTIPEDDGETAARLRKQTDEIGDMVQLGFLKDTTGKILEQIAGLELRSGRKIKAYIITDIGFDMFNNPKKRMPV